MTLNCGSLPSPRITQRSITSSGTLHARSRSGVQDSSFAARTAIFSSGFSVAAIHGSCTRLDSATGMSSFAVQKLSGEGWLVPDDRRRLRVKDITRKSIEDIYSFREIMETHSLQKIVETIRNKDYDTAYFYLKRDHFDHSIGVRSVADLVELRLQTLRAAEKSKKK